MMSRAQRHVLWMSVALLLLSSGRARGADWYVSPTGNDQSGDGTLNNPWFSVQHGVDAAQANDTILVMDDDQPDVDDFQENIVIPADKKGLTIKAEGDDAVLPRIKSADPAVHVFTVQADGVTLERLELHGTSIAMAAGVYFDEGTKDGLVDGCNLGLQWGKSLSRGVWTAPGSHNHTIVNNTFNACSDGIFLQGADKEPGYHLAQGNIISDTTYGITSDGCSENQVLENDLSNCNNSGIAFKNGDLNLALDNIIEGGSVWTLGSDGNVIDTNIIHGMGLTFQNSAYNVIRFNDITGTANMDGGHDSVWLDNDFSNGTVGFKITSGAGHMLVGNTFQDYSQECLTLASGNNRMFFNTVKNCGKSGVATAVGNLFAGNRFENNPDGPASFFGQPKDTWSTENKIVYRYGGKAWKGHLGNSYDSYAGLDDGSDGGVAGDGIGDTDLPVVTSAQGDLYPLAGLPGEYQPEMWHVSGDGKLTLDEFGTPGFPLEIPAWGYLVLPVELPAQKDITYVPGNADEQTSWTWRFSMNWIPPGSQGVRAEMGWLDEAGFHTNQEGPEVTVTNPDNKSVFQGAMEGAVFTVPAGARLALRFVSFHSQAVSLYPYTSYVSPSGPGTPEYPVGGQTGGALEVTPAFHDFGEVLFGQAVSTTFVVKNAGVAGVAVYPFVLTGPDASDFSIAGTTCPVDGELGAEQECTVDVELSPPYGGKKQGALYVVTGDEAVPYKYVPMSAHAGPQYKLTVQVEPPTGGTVEGAGGIDCPAVQCEAVFDAGAKFKYTATAGPQSQFLSWQGCDEPSGAECVMTLNSDKTLTAKFDELLPEIAVDPTEVAFGEAYVGIGSDPVQIAVSNSGTWDLDIESIALEGEDPGQFSLELGGCRFDVMNLAPEASCELTARFVPTVAGPATAAIRIASDDPATPEVEVPLSGTGVSAPRTLRVVILPGEGGSVSGQGIDCPSDCEETFPATIALDLTVEVNSGYSLIGWQNCDAAQEASCGLTLTEDRTVYVLLNKLTPGVHQDVGLLDFGEIQVSQTSEPATATITNLGNASLTLSPTEVSGIFASDFAVTSDSCSSATLPPLSDCKVTVAFSPKAAMTRAATVRWTTNAPSALEVTVGLRGWGQANGDGPDDPDNPLPSGPLMHLFAGRINFAETAVGETSEHMFAVENQGDEPLQVQNVQVDGGDDSQFSASHSCITQLAPGAMCEIYVTFKPTSSGSKQSTLWVSSNAAMNSSQTVQLVGEATGGGGGCSNSRSPTRAAAFMLVLLLCCLASLRRRHVHLAVGLALLVIVPTGCWDATKDCRGFANVEADGEWLGRLNIVQRHEAKARHDMWNCYPMAFTIQQVEYEGGISLNFALPAPLYTGRRYGKGTAVTISGAAGQRTCWVTDGGISVDDIVLPEEPQACTEFIKLYFNLEAICPEQTPQWEELTQGTDILKGTASFSYDDDEDCAPPHLAISSYFTGDSIAPPGIPDLRSRYYPVEYMGTEVNLLTLKRTSVVVDDGTQVPVQKEFSLQVEPQGAAGLGNYFCSYLLDAPGADAPICDPSVIPAPLDIALDDNAGGGLPSIVFQDVFGAYPVLPLGQVSTGPPIVTSPKTGQGITGPAPLTVSWNPPGNGEDVVTIRLLGDAATPLAEFTVPDTGTVELEPAFWGDYVGPGFAEVERSAPSAQAGFPWPVAPGSSFVISDIHRISVTFGMSSAAWPDPQAPSDVWADPVKLGDGQGVAEWHPWPSLVIDDEGVLAASWFGNVSGMPAAQVQWLDTFEGEWIDPGMAVSMPLTHGPVGLAFRDGATLTWGYKYDQGTEFVPTAYLVTQDWNVTGGTIPGSEGHEKLWRLGGGLLSGNDSVLVMGEKNGDRLMGSVNGAPFQQLVSADLGAATVTLFVGQDDMALAGYQVGSQARMYRWDPLGPPGSDNPINVPSFVSAVFGFQARRADLAGMLHYVWVENDPGEPSVVWHSVLDSSTVQTVGQDEAVYSGLGFGKLDVSKVRIAVGLDQSLWVLVTSDCDYGSCPVLFHRVAPGFWEGPTYPAHAVDAVDLAVDMTGRVHLVFMPTDELSGYQPFGVYHTVMEVAP